jgi:Secreted protein acidic and rich in cysteine Ca binding region/EF hand
MPEHRKQSYLKEGKNMPAHHTSISVAIAATLALSLSHPVSAQIETKPQPKIPNCNLAKEVMECVLIDFWHFFKEGDRNRDGYLDNEEFMAHPVYKEAEYDLATKTFIFWMADDNKDGKISLQEWFNNELGQFQMGDTNHNGLIDSKEYQRLLKIQAKLFKDGKLGGQ